MAQRNILTGPFDAATQMADGASAVTSSGQATVGGVARSISVGTGFLDATLTVDVDNVDITSGDEVYELRLQGSTTPDFSSDVVNLATVRVGKALTSGGSADVTTGRINRRFLNSPNGSENAYPPSGGYPYLRMYHAISGTTPTITYRAFITKNQLQG